MNLNERLRKKLGTTITKPQPRIELSVVSYADKGQGGTPENWIRFDQSPPESMTRLLSKNVKVAGVTKPGFKDKALAFAHGTNQVLWCEQEPSNPYDKNAIKVLAAWTNAAGEPCRGHVGYIPAKSCLSIHKANVAFPLAATLELVFLPTAEKSLGMRISIWGPES